ncbi:MAG TPA: glycosyltransferase, partial [Candidatus Eisenbacteria bacterium]|nr:glycosyltransferase [Candidatus Eisenbacteria bacterium]
MKRVLIVARFFPPGTGGGVYRTLGFTRHLPEFGYEPVVLTGPDLPPNEGDPELLASVPRLEIVRAGRGSPFAAVRSKTNRPPWISALARAASWIAIPDSYAGWRGDAVRAGLERLKRGDLSAVYSTSPPDTDHLVALDLHRASGLPWVADFRDPWIGLGYRDPPTQWHRAAHQRLLRDVLRHATRVVAATEGTERWLRAVDPSIASRSSVIPNGFEAEEWRGVVPRRFDRFTIIHAGRLSDDRTLEPFARGLAAFLARDPARRAAVQCLLLGPHDADQARAVERAGLDGVVRFEGNRSHAETLSMEAGADLLILVKSRSARFRDLVPGKLYEYLGAG